MTSNGTRLLYIANARIPSEKAHTINIMKMCEAFAHLDVEVELVVPKRTNPITTNPFEYYAVKPLFKITKTWTLDLVEWGRIGTWIQMSTFNFSSALFALRHQADIYYARDHFSLLLLSLFNKRFFFEMHSALHGVLEKRILKRASGLIVTTNHLKQFCLAVGVPENQILVAPNGVDVKTFAIALSKEEAREKLNLPKEKNLVIYTGHLYEWKGAHILAQAAKYLSEDNQVIFVGGTEEDLVSFRSRFGKEKKLRILGQQPYQSMPTYLKAADVLVLPNVPITEEGTYYTAPIKLFEYMASGTPIVASRIPSIEETLNEKNSIFIEPNDPQALAKGIQKTLSDEAAGAMRAREAQKDVENLDWGKRAKRILKFLKQRK